MDQNINVSEVLGLRLDFRLLADPIEDQLAKQGLQFNPLETKRPGYWESHAHAINLLSGSKFLTEAEKRRFRSRLIRRIAKVIVPAA